MSIRLQFEDCLGDFENSNTQHEVFGVSNERHNKILEEYANILYDMFMKAFVEPRNKLDIRALKVLFESKKGLDPREYSWLMLNLRGIVASTLRLAENDYALQQAKLEEESKKEDKVDTSKLISLKHRKDGQE